MLGRRKKSEKGFDLLGSHKDQGGISSTGSKTAPTFPTGESSGPRMHRADSGLAPRPRTPPVEAPRRAAPRM